MTAELFFSLPSEMVRVLQAGPTQSKQGGGLNHQWGFGVQTPAYTLSLPCLRPSLTLNKPIDLLLLSA